ncbi:MAG: hypothetical protein R6V57_00215 [Vicinamibacterales bacterium]
MRHARIHWTAVVMTLACSCLAGAAASQTQAPATIDVTGAWALEVQTEAGAGTPQVTFKQDGEKLTGHYSSAVLGEAELAGSIKGQAIEFTVAASVQGNAISITFTGTVDDASSMKGRVTFAGMGEGTFTGKRK